MIYISSSCIKAKYIKDAVLFLAEHGIRNIELSGGTEFYEGLEDDLLHLKDKYSLNYLVHNYFPPPKESFILNLASLDDRIWNRTIDFMKDSISLAIRLQSPLYGLHAGFFVNPGINEIGNKFVKQQLFDKEKAIHKFVDGLKILQSLYSDKITLYVENNVVSASNYEGFGDNPFMLTNVKDYDKLYNMVNFNLLLDVGHLKVSSNTLGLNFENELNRLMAISEYVHISDNNGISDQNCIIKPDTFLYNYLNIAGISNKIVTLEIYEDFNKISFLYDEMRVWH